VLPLDKSVIHKLLPYAMIDYARRRLAHAAVTAVGLVLAIGLFATAGQGSTNSLATWLGNLAHLDLGRTADGDSVTAAIADALWPSLLLIGGALCITLVFGWCGGLLLAAIGDMTVLERKEQKSGSRRTSLRLHPARALVRGLVAMAQTCQGVPTFWLGGLLVALFSIALGWLPPGGIAAFDLPAFGSPDYRAALLAHPLTVLGDLLTHLLLPAFTLALAGLATPLRLIGATLRREWHSHHAQVARGLGLSRRRLLWRAARPTLPAVIGGSAGDIPLLAGALVLVEYLFGWPGLGLLAYHAARAGDSATLEALALFTGLAIIATGLIADLAAAWADPRVRAEVGT
jgi:ABC-type dipeptide/oligopeptide/nickel transport system permease component